MSNRERWIVYPLLFMVMLKTFLRDPMVKPYSFHCQSISCNQLSVNSVDGKPLVQISNSGSQAGQIRLFGSQNHLTMLLHADRGGQRGRLEVINDGRAPDAVIAADEGGGYVQLNSEPLVSSIFLGHDSQRQVSGLFATGDSGAVVAVYEDGSLRPWGSSFPWKALEHTSDSSDETKPSTEGQPDEQPGAAAADTEDSSSRADGRESSSDDPPKDSTSHEADHDANRQEAPESSEESGRQTP